ncbi:zinc-dependent metalloprotease [Thalassotalea sp. G2M2-11]|uniref:zinc-dependent metalloprotease n=1 Tax=Thalassotalea sp. G2M2-11 TaxID=2787627 RepID=UPI0019D11C8C|nr:zinc-dependent metalloprotease [Thalassotalea sp. G2M2-11]
MHLVKNILLLLVCSIFSLSVSANYTEFVEGKTHHQGYFSFYLDDTSGKVYLVIDKFEQEFLFQSSLPQGIGSNDIGLDRGQLGDTRLVQFERVGNKVFLRQKNSYYRANSKNKLEQQAVEQAFASSIIWGFNVAQTSDDGQSVLVDYTPFLLSDIHNISEKLKQRKQGSFSIDSSRSGLYAKRSKAFPENTELEARVTYKGSGAGKYLRSVTPDSHAVTVNLHHSLIKLPDDKYQSRAFHPYSGFWAISFADYASAIDEPLVKRVIPRHRLAKKNPSAKISEAVEPIVYYLDAGVPEPVRSALLDGAKWWDQAFAAIGYKNAFQVKMLPEDADPMDVRYNVIQWVHRATRGWSYGASVIDPRTGEIIKGHVTLGSLRVRQDYLIALGLTSPFTSKQTDTSEMKEMALARIRQLAAHEVGHTLGIAHNFAASVNNRASVMDYPHPLITLTNGEIDLSQAYDDKIGVWDKHVIAYGYADVRSDEPQYLAQTIKAAQNKGLLYMSDADARPRSGAHVSGHLWDNGANAAQELQRVLAVRAKALADFGITSIPVDTPLSELERVLVPIYNFHRYQVEAAVKLIAGVDYQYQVREQAFTNSLQPVSGERQQQAFAALLDTLASDTLTLPEHIINLIPPKAYGYQRDRESFTSQTGLTFDPVSAAQASAKHTLTLLLNSARLARLQQQAVRDENILSVGQLFEQLIDQTIHLPSQSGLASLVQQRVNQQVIEQLLALWQEQGVVSEVRAEVFVTLTALEKWLTKKSSSRQYQSYRAHFALLAQQIRYGLTHNELMPPASNISLPPGSPIGS